MPPSMAGCGRRSRSCCMPLLAGFRRSRATRSISRGAVRRPDPRRRRPRRGDVVRARQRAGAAAGAPPLPPAPPRRAARRHARWCRPGRSRSRSARASARDAAADQRRPALADLCRQARPERRLPAAQGGQGAGADLRAAGRRLRRACRLRARHRGQAGHVARGRPCARCSICRPAACGSRAASATRAFRPGRFRSTSTTAASSSRATSGRSPSTS